MVFTEFKNLNQGYVKLDVWQKTVESTTRWVGLRSTGQKGE
jgi:hypothetical protein